MAKKYPKNRYANQAPQPPEGGYDAWAAGPQGPWAQGMPPPPYAWGPYGYYGPPPAAWGEMPPGAEGGWPAGPAPWGPGYAPGAPGAMPHGAGMLGWLSNRQMEQFIIGLLLGGAAAYVLGDADKRARLMRMVMKLYAGVAGSVEEFKEQIADLKAEVAAEQGGGFEP